MISSAAKALLSSSEMAVVFAASAAIAREVSSARAVFVVAISAARLDSTAKALASSLEMAFVLYPHQ